MARNDKMKTKRTYIYCIYFPTSNKHYIGQTDNINRRMVHGHLRSNKSLVGRALWKYDDWTIEIFHTCKTRDEANRTEIEEIRHHSCVAPNGYNLTRGGEGSGIPCEETKEKMRQARLGTHWQVCEEGCKNMAEARIGNQNAKGHRWILSPIKIKQRTIKQLKNKIAKLETEI